MMRELDTRDSVRIVTSNKFISACGLEGISLKARKLLYITISQSRKDDKGFYEYSIKANEFAKLIGISASHVYEEAENISKELIKGYISYKQENEKKFTLYSLFSTCKYTEKSELIFKLNQDMTDFLLELQGNFSKPLLSDFLKMNSPYSMAIWHLMQREMQSKKPNMTEVMTFSLSLEEMREVTGTQTKLKKLSQFKDKVLDKAIREIADNCGVDITYTYQKKARAVIGFDFSAKNQIHIDENKIPQNVKDKADLFKLKETSKNRELTPEERAEYERLIAKAEQMELDI